MNSFFHQYRSPAPPPELKDQVFLALQKQRLVTHTQSWIDRIWMNRALRVSWLTAVIVLTFFLTVWDPSQNSLESVTTREPQEKNADDPDMLQWMEEAELDSRLARNQREALVAEDL